MRVIFDNQIEILRNSGGISVYFTELVKALSKRQDLSVTHSPPEPLGAPIESSATLLHHTFYIPLFPSTFNRYPKIVTVFDFIPERSAGFRIRHAHMSKQAYLRKADGVIFISETVREQAENYGIRPRISAVTPLASRFVCNDQLPFNEREKTVLFVGRRGGYKNFSLIPKVLRQVVEEIELLVVGGGPLRKSELRSLKENGIKYRHLEKANDTELRQLYLNSRALLMPSKEEGFGLPIVEAMSLGCPVIGLETKINYEVGGAAFVSLASEDPKAWADMIALIVSDEATWNSHSSKSKIQASRYSWDSTAELTARLYQDVLDEASGVGI